MYKDGIKSCVCTLGLAFASQDEISSWISFICTCAIAVTMAGIQIYRMIRDRDTDKEKKKHNKEDNTNG